MDASVISGVILPIVFIVVGVALVWALVELIKVLRRTRTTVETMEAEITPILKDVREITESVKPAADKVDPLVERVSLAANLEIMRLDGILENVNEITETAASAANAVDAVANTPLRIVNTATEKLRDAFSGRKASDESACLAEARESGADKGMPSASGDGCVREAAKDEAAEQPRAAHDEGVSEESLQSASQDCVSCSDAAKSEPSEAGAQEKYFTYGSKQE